MALVMISPANLVFASTGQTEDDGWVEGDYEGSLKEQEEQAQEDWENAGRPGEDNGDGDALDEGDKPAAPDDSENNNDEDYTVTCWNGEEVSELSDCPEDDGSVTCPDGVTEVIRLSDCPEIAAPPAPLYLPPAPTSAPAPAPAPIPFLESNEGQQEQPDDKHNPYCDLVPEDFKGACHDRKDASDYTGLYTCNDGTHKEHWEDCEDASGYDYNGNGKEDDESPQSTTAKLATAEPDWTRFNPTGGGVYFPTESVPNFDRLKIGPFGILLLNQAGEEFGPSATSSTTGAEVSSCKVDGSADGMLQKFDAAKYQACGLYMNGQKAYSEGFVTGCTQVGNTQQICQALADSSILNTKMQSMQTQAQTARQPTQTLQPNMVDK